jgi:hypothetical protein
MSWSPCTCRTNRTINSNTNEFTFYSYNNMFKVCCLRLYFQTLNVYNHNGYKCDFSCTYYYRLLNYQDFKYIVYNKEIILVHMNEKINDCTYLNNTYKTIVKVKNIDIDENLTFVNTYKYNDMVKCKTNYDNVVSVLINKNSDILYANKNLENKINKLEEELNKKDMLNKRLIDTLMLYRYKEFNNTTTYDYDEIKQKNKALNNEFKRVAKLIKLC